MQIPKSHTGVDLGGQGGGGVPWVLKHLPLSKGVYKKLCRRSIIMIFAFESQLLMISRLDDKKSFCQSIPILLPRKKQSNLEHLRWAAILTVLLLIDANVCKYN